MVERFQAAPEHLYVGPAGSTPAVILQRLEAEVDELWSFVGRKANRQRVWLAVDASTRQVLAYHVGDRSDQSAQGLWDKIPTKYQEQAMFYTDQYKSTKVSSPVPASRHLQGRPQDQSRGALQWYVTAASLPAGTLDLIVLKEPCQSYRDHQIFHLRL